MRNFILALSMLVLTACTQSVGAVKLAIQQDAEFNEIVLEDVQQAKLLAENSGDVLGLKCWSYIEEFTLANSPGDETEAGTVVGIFSAYQNVRNIRRTIVEVKVSDQFRLECGPMLTDSMGALGRIGIRLALPVLF